MSDPLPPIPDDDFHFEDEDQVEQAMRWRLILGKYADDYLGYDSMTSACPEGSDLAGLMEQAQRMDVSLSYIYDREHSERSARTAGRSSSGLSVPMWLQGVRDLFPQEAVNIIEQDALTRYGLNQLITDPEILRKAQPNEDLLKAILQFKHMMKGDVLEAAREVVKAVVEQLAEKIRNECHSALHGAIDPEQRPPERTFRNVNWPRTIQRNLRNYDTENEQLIVDRVFFKHRQKKKSSWNIIVSVDQSGSMTDSLIHSAVMAAIFASLPSVEVHLVLWDTRVVDVSEHVGDPLEVLMSSQLGGGTQMLPAMTYCADLITEPERTIFVLISDWYIWGETQQCLQMAHEMHEAGVIGIGLCALDQECRPVYDEKFARDLADRGWFVAALTPKKLAEHVGKLIA